MTILTAQPQLLAADGLTHCSQAEAQTSTSPMPDYWQKAQATYHEATQCLAENKLDPALAWFSYGAQQFNRIDYFWEFNIIRTQWLLNLEEQAVSNLFQLSKNSNFARIQDDLRQWLASDVAGKLRLIEVYTQAIIYLQEDTTADADLAQKYLDLAPPLLNRYWAQLVVGQSPIDNKTATASAKGFYTALDKLYAPHNDASNPQNAKQQSLRITAYKKRLSRLARIGSCRIFYSEFNQLPAKIQPALDLYDSYFYCMLNLRKYTEATKFLTTPLAKQRLNDFAKSQLRLLIAQKLFNAAEQLVLEQQKQPAAKWFALHEMLFKARWKSLDIAELATYVEESIALAPSNYPLDDFYWAIIWKLYRKNEYEQALRWIDNSQNKNIEQKSMFLYWQGRMLLKTDATTAAQHAWDKLKKDYPQSYYTVMANYYPGFNFPYRQPLQLDAPYRKLNNVELTKLWSNQTQQEALFFLQNEYYSLFEQYLLPNMSSIKPAELWLQVLLEHNQLSWLTLKLDSSQHLDDAQASYPPAFRAITTNLAQKTPLSLLMAIMIEESHFRPRVISLSGAIGLMQLMPTTASAIATENGIEYAVERLIEPNLNIAIGAAYILKNLKRFDYNPVHVASAYNAGPTITRRWVNANQKLALDEFVEEIPYSETRNYVRRVIRSMMAYQRIYQIN